MKVRHTIEDETYTTVAMHKFVAEKRRRKKSYKTKYTTDIEEADTVLVRDPSDPAKFRHIDAAKCEVIDNE